MIPERWQRIEELYHAALDVEPSRRGAFLDAACAGDAEMRHELDSLLVSNVTGEDSLEKPARQVAAHLIGESEAGSLAGRRVGAYAIRTLLGAGGMGEVYSAHGPNARARAPSEGLEICSHRGAQCRHRECSMRETTVGVRELKAQLSK